MRPAWHPRRHLVGAGEKRPTFPVAPAGHGEIGVVHTWTVPSNLAMHHTSTALGFRVVEHMYEVESVIA